jgi:hypothetical protein
MKGISTESANLRLTEEIGEHHLCIKQMYAIRILQLCHFMVKYLKDGPEYL